MPTPASPPEVPPRARKPKVPKIAKERKPREKPARTLRVRIAELGPHHLEAFDLVTKGNEIFASEVRVAIQAKDAVDKAYMAVLAAADAHKEAEIAHADAVNVEEESRAVLACLDAKAALVAQLRDDTLDAPKGEAVTA